MRVQFQVQPAQLALDHLPGGLGLAPAPAKHDQIVGIAHQTQPLAGQCLVKGVQVDIAQQRRKDPALGRPRCPGLPSDVQDPGLEPVNNRKITLSRTC